MSYIPDRGDVVWINLNPQSGHEQSGHRPVLVLSPSSYNGKVGLMVCCPITTQSKGYPFEVAISNNPKVTGVILADQVKSLDWKARGVKKQGEVSEFELKETLKKLKVVIEI
ncbi:MAG: endoribonuclease MazF [Thermodesulfovibrionales bacterium]|nr:endoribonuclease MazF [Thermodesulfovibrionales bacterium]